jgi:hypothetical protein
MTHPGCRSLRSCDEVAAAVQPGLRAVKTAHHVLFADPAAFECSADLDRARQPFEPNAPRWDYILVGSEGLAVGAEVHAAKASEVDRVIAKKRWAERLVERCGLRVDRWYWIRPLGSRVQFTRLSPKARSLAKNGIQFPTSRVP